MRALIFVLLASSFLIGCGQALQIDDVVGTWRGQDAGGSLTLNSDGTFVEDVVINQQHVGNHGTFTLNGDEIRFQIQDGDAATGRVVEGVLTVTDPGGETRWVR